MGKRTDKAPGHGRILKWVLAVLLVVLLAVGGYFLVTKVWAKPAAHGNGFFDAGAIEGNLPTKTDQEIQDELNRIVEEGMFNISIAPTITFENSDSEGQARIENIEANRYHMKVTITLDDTGETVYESKGIKPGSYIENIKLSETLSKGEYKATATFSAYKQGDLTEVGTAAASIMIIMGET